MKLTRKQVKEALQTVPIDQILSVPGELTHKQREFARLVAMGKTGAEAYRVAYNAKGKPKTVGNHASDLKKHEGIAREIEAYRLANEAAKYRTPQQLRELVIHSLVKIAIDEDVKAATRVQAAKVLGTVTEVAAFTERREVKHVQSSEDARAALMAKLREVMNAGAVDVESRTADSLLAEITGEAGNDAGQSGNVTTYANLTDTDSPRSDAAIDAEAAMHDDNGQDMDSVHAAPTADPAAVDFSADDSATPTAPNDVWSPSPSIHTIPHTRSDSEQIPPPSPSDFSAESLEAELETPPVSKRK